MRLWRRTAGSRRGRWSGRRAMLRGPFQEAAPRVVEGSFEVGGQEHFYLEGQVAAGAAAGGGGYGCPLLDPASDRGAAQGCPCFAPADERGAGGSAADGRGVWRQGIAGECALAIACAVAARATGRPCRMRYDRDDDMVITGKRHDLRIMYRAGWTIEGRILGLEFTHLFRCGWSQDLSPAGGGPGDAACGQLLSFGPCADRIASAEDQHLQCHGLSRVRRAAGDGGDRAGHGPCGHSWWAGSRWRCARPTSIAGWLPPGALRPPDPQRIFLDRR